MENPAQFWVEINNGSSQTHLSTQMPSGRLNRQRRVALEVMPLRLVAFQVGQLETAFIIGLEPMVPEWLYREGHRCSAERARCGMDGCRAYGQSFNGSSMYGLKAASIASFALVRIDERGSLGLVSRSSTVWRLRDVATAFWLMSNSRFSVASKACKPY